MAQQWVQWDDETGQMLGMVRRLPPGLQGRDAAHLAKLGYRELVTAEPEDFIPRFPSLLGQSEFKLLGDGRVKQTFPKADFSVKAVRSELKALARTRAGQELAATDWYLIRQLELGTPVPAEVVTLRKKIRDHVDWLDGDIDKKSARALVDYQFMFPKAADQTMVRGLPVHIEAVEPDPLDPLPVPDDPEMPVTGEAQGVFGNDDPTVLEPAPEPPPPVRIEPAPATTDGPVPVWNEEDGRPDFLSAEGLPLITAYAPTVEDTGPEPDHN